MQTLNTVTVVGMLVENELKKDFINGKNCIRGYISLLVGDNRVRIEYYSNELTSKGAANKPYGDLTDLMNNGKCFVPENPTGEVTYVKVDKGTIENSDYYEASGNLLKSVKVRANFVQVIKNIKPEQITATFEFVGRIEGMYPEIVNDAETGRLQVDITGIDYNGAANPISVMIPVESDGVKLAEAFGSVFQVGNTTKIGGAIINTMETRTITEAVAWGKPTEKVITSVTREFVGLGGSPAFMDNDPSYITDELLVEAANGRIKKLEDAKAKQAAKAAASAATAQSNSGFGGNANAFNQAVQPQTGGAANPFAQAAANGRPTF